MLSSVTKCNDFTPSTGNDNKPNCFQDGQLPGVEVKASETSIQSWSGMDKTVNAALLFNFFVTLEPSDRQVLFQQLFTHHLAPNGIAVVIADLGGPTTGFMYLLERLGSPAKGYYDEVERDMLAVGFSLVYAQDIMTPEDLSDPSDDLLKYIQTMAVNEVSAQEVRAAIADIFESVKLFAHKKMGIFKK